jgi:hypothetical protein
MSHPESSLEKGAVTSAIVSPIPVPTHGREGNFTVLAKVHINASPITTLNAVRNTNSWPNWNTFCPSCKIPATSSPERVGWLELGTAATITYVMSGASGGSSGEQGIKISLLDLDHEFSFDDGTKRKGCRIAWISTGRAHWQLHSERVMEFVEVDGGGSCSYTCWETFGGVLATAAKLTVGGKLRDRFGNYARDLKGFVEGESVHGQV